ncbi:MAG: hypothetical protein IPO37_17885 [Saprospiraceae bacterium]|nr:hypothetical protein [Saprospiraceae bacterium]
MIISYLQAGLSKTDITSIQHKIKSFSFTLSDQAIAKQIHIIKKIVDAIAQNQRLLLHCYDIEKQKCQIFKVARIKDISPIYNI